MRIKKILIFFIPIFLILVFWKNTLLHLSTHLYDWHDIPFVIWVFQNNIKHIGVFNFAYSNETNAMYPFLFSLSFTEHMYFPSLIVSMLTRFTSNAITQFNILAIANHIALYVSAYLLIGRVVKDNWPKILAGFFIAFSPYFFTQLGHFQMIFFWPLLISWYFLLHPNRQVHHYALGGLFLAWQFMSSMYIGVMGILMIFIYYFLRLFVPQSFSFATSSKKELEDKWKAFLVSYYSILDKKKPQNIVRILTEIGVLLFIFIFVVGPTFEAYSQMQNTYKPVIEQGQYVTYSAHITDYFFPLSNGSVLSRMTGWWRGLNKHVSGELAAFMGFIPLAVIGYWASQLRRNKTTKGTQWAVIWSLLLILVGILFSLGPRFNFNGNYLVFPLPYYLVLKIFPFIGFMRALARWYLVVTLGVAILFAISLELISSAIKNKLVQKMFFPLVFILLIIEFYPAPLEVSNKNWWTKGYKVTKSICKNNPQPMLEYPFDYRASDTTVSKDLQYKTSILLASTNHDCEILSGFSGYTPKKYLEYRDFLQNREFNRGVIKLLYDIGLRYVKLNLTAMQDEEKKQITNFTKLRYVKKLYEDKTTIIIQLRQLTKYELIYSY